MLVQSGYRTAWDMQPETCPTPPDIKTLYPDDFNDKPLTLNTYPWLSAPHLPRMMTRGQHEDYLRLMETLDGLFHRAGITYIIAGATLMGSYMMHDVMPWDDDIDIWIDLADLPKVKRLFSNQTLRQEYEVTSFWSFRDEFSLENLQTFPRNAPDHEYYVYKYQAHKASFPIKTLNHYINGEYHMFKFFRHNASRIGHWPLRPIITRPWKWPFIDIFFFTKNKTHVWNYEAPIKINVLNRSDFFPLHKRPLGRLWLPAPYNPYAVLKVRVPSFQCYRSEHSHQDDAIHLKSPVCCSSLHPYYPMVTPDRGEGGGDVIESLQFGGKVIQTVHIKGEAPSPLSKRPHDLWFEC